jgi:hypothetical protein
MFVDELDGSILDCGALKWSHLCPDFGHQIGVFLQLCLKSMAREGDESHFLSNRDLMVNYDWQVYTPQCRQRGKVNNLDSIGDHVLSRGNIVRYYD